MAVLQNVPCGGILLDDKVFAVVGDIITLKGYEEQPIPSTVTMCSLEFNSDYFQIVGSPYQFILTSAARDTETEDMADITTFTANCGGLRLDAEYFELTDDLVITGDIDKILGEDDDDGDNDEDDDDGDNDEDDDNNQNPDTQSNKSVNAEEE